MDEQQPASEPREDWQAFMRERQADGWTQRMIMWFLRLLGMRCGQSTLSNLASGETEHPQTGLAQALKALGRPIVTEQELRQLALDMEAGRRMRLALEYYVRKHGSADGFNPLNHFPGIPPMGKR
jgi:hypothetical protein